MNKHTWYVLTDGENFWGQQWEVYNASLRRPRHCMGPLNEDRAFKARLCHGLQEAAWEQRRARDICGLELGVKEVEFSSERQEARILIK